MSDSLAKIAVIGGTGELGRGLSLRCAAAGYPVIIGSRSAERAETAAAEIASIANGAVHGASYVDAAAAAEIIILAVPYSAHKETLLEIKEAVDQKLVIDTTVPLKPPKVMRVQLPEAGCAALEAEQILGDSVQLTSAFHNVAAVKLNELDRDLDCDVLVFGNAQDARQRVVDLSEAIGLTAWQAGPLPNSAVAESMTSTLIFLNKRYKIKGAGIKITGKPGI